MKHPRFALNTTSIFNLLLFLYLFTYPLYTTVYQSANMVAFFYQIILAFSLVLIWGFCGIFSFGQAAFFGIGGYVYAFFTLNMGAQWTPVGLILALAAGFLVALILGYFLFYGGVSDSSIGVITLCFTLACMTFMSQTSGDAWKIGTIRMGGYNGINNIPVLRFGDFLIRGKVLYYFVLLIVFLLFMIFIRMKRRPVGYSMIALRENTHRSRLLGYNTAKIKTLTFAFGGMIAALAGVIYAMWGGYIVPSSMSMVQGTIPVVLAAAGGRNNPTAVTIFALLYLYFSQWLAVQGTMLSNIVLGVVLILVMLFVPNGIIQEAFRWIDRKVFRIQPDGYLERSSIK